MHGLSERKCHPSSAHPNQAAPFGLSRRQKPPFRQRQLGFEPLEGRQMLSAESPLVALQALWTTTSS